MWDSECSAGSLNQLPRALWRGTKCHQWLCLRKVHGLFLSLQQFICRNWSCAALFWGASRTLILHAAAGMGHALRGQGLEITGVTKVAQIKNEKSSLIIRTLQSYLKLIAALLCTSGVLAGIFFVFILCKWGGKGNAKVKSRTESFYYVTMLCLFLHFITGNLIIYAGILETPQLLCSQHCLIRDLWKSLCAKEKGVDRNKLFTVTQNYLTGKFRDKLLFKSPCYLWNKLGGGGSSIHLHCKVFLLKQRERKKYLKGERETLRFFIATLRFLPVVLEFPLGRKTNIKAANYRDERKSQWRETVFLQIVQRWQNTNSHRQHRQRLKL